MRSAAATISVIPDGGEQEQRRELALLLVAGSREVLVAEEQAERGDDEQEEPREDGEAVGRDRATEHGRGPVPVPEPEAASRPRGRRRRGRSRGGRAVPSASRAPRRGGRRSRTPRGRARAGAARRRARGSGARPVRSRGLLERDRRRDPASPTSIELLLGRDAGDHGFGGRDRSGPSAGSAPPRTRARSARTGARTTTSRRLTSGNSRCSSRTGPNAIRWYDQRR